MVGAPIRRARKQAGTEETPFVPAWPGQQFEGQRPPFEKNNTLSMRHGAHSDRTLAPIAAGWVRVATEQAAYLRDPSFEPALQAWARFEAKCDVLHAWIDEHGIIDAKGQATPAAKLLPIYEGRAASLRATLGMDPVSRAKLQRDTAAAHVDLAQLMAEPEPTEQDHDGCHD